MLPVICKWSSQLVEIFPARSLTRSLRLWLQQTGLWHWLPTTHSQRLGAHRVPRDERTIAKQARRAGGFHNGGTPQSATTDRAARAPALVCGRMSPGHRFKRLVPSRTRSFRAIHTDLCPATLVAAIFKARTRG